MKRNIQPTWTSLFILFLLISVVCLCSIQQTEAKFSFKSAFNKVKSSVSNKVKSTESKLRGGINKVKSSVSNKIKSTESKIRGGINKVKQNTNKVKSFVQKKVSKTVSRAVPKVFNKIKSTQAKIRGGINKVKSSVSNKFKSTQKKIRGGINKVKNFKSTVQKKISKSKVFNKIQEKTRKNFTRAKQTFNKAKNGLRKIKEKSKQFANKFKNSKFARKLKEKSSKFKNNLKKFGSKVKNSKIGKKISKKIESAKQKFRKVGGKLDGMFKNTKKKLKEKIKKVSTSVKNKVMKKLEKLKQVGGKLKGTKVWKEISKQLNKAKTVISAIKNSKHNDQTRGVEKIKSLNGMKGNQRVSALTSITAKTVEIASQMSNNAYEKSSDKNLEKQGYQVVMSKDHKKEMVASKVYYNPKDKTLVVSYRGTVATSLKDWGNNLKVELKPAYFDGKYAGKLHTGFYNNYMKDRTEINNLISQYQKEGKIDKIVFTGHSKGGALSEIAATDYELNNKNSGIKVELVTFGGPRVGDKEHAKIVNDNVKDYVRVVNTFEKKGKTKKDIVTEVPPQLFGYAHAGAEVQVGCQKGNGVSCHLLDNYLTNMKPE